MKKRLMLALTMLLCVLLLCSCGEQKKYDVKTSETQGTTQQNPGATQSGAANTTADDENYDPLAEEDDYTDDAYWGEIEISTPEAATATPAPTMRSEYAGATPVVIDPIDKPTPEPAPKVQVSYTDYDATKLGLSFQGPAGWTVNDEASDTFVIQNPQGYMNYYATLTLRAEKVSKDYTMSELKAVVKSMLSAIESFGFETYSPSNTDTRMLLGKTGVYANYSGTLSDGKISIAGRVHAVCVDGVLYTLHLTTPKDQWSDYKEQVYDKLRDTITITK